MDDGGEIDLKFALEVHGVHRRAFSESESDHSSDFDEYEEYKPLPVEITSDNVIVIYPSDEENKSTDTNIKEGIQSVEDPTDQPIQNVINTAAIRKESLNHSTIQNDLNGNLPGIRPDFPNPNLQNFNQPIQNHYNPHAIKLVPVFPNFNNMQQFPQNVYNVPNPTIRIRPDFPYSNNMQQFQQPIQNYYNPHAVRVCPVFPNPNNMQQFPQNNSNPNSERIRQYFPNPSNMQQPQNDSNLNAERIISEFFNPSNMEQPQAVQNHSNPNSERIRTEFSNPSNVQQPQTVQNDSNPNSERIRTEFSNPSNVQQPQTVQNDSNPNAERIRTEFSNPSNMQQPQAVQNDSNPNSERIRPYFPNPSNMQQPQTVQNDSNPNAERIRPYFPNPINIQHPQIVQNDYNPNAERIRPYFPNPINIQHPQIVQNDSNPNAERIRTEFSNPSNMQQPQAVQNDSNPNSERIRPYFPNPSNMQQPQTVQNDSNPNSERIRPYFPNPINIQHPQIVQNDSNPNAERIRTEFSNPSNMQQPQAVQNDSNPNSERIRPYFPNPSNMQQPQTVQNDSNPNAERIRPYFPNPSNVQQPQIVQNDYNPNAERIRPYFPNPSNVQQPQIVQNDYNPNAERIRPYFTNPSSMQHFQNLNNLRAANFQHPIRMPQFYQTNQYIQNFNTGNSTAPILNNFLPNVTSMGYNPYQSNQPLSAMPVPPYGQPYLNHPPNQYWQHPNQFQGGTLIKNTPPNETKSNYFPKGIQMTPKTVDIMNMFGEEDYQAASKSKEEKNDICNAGDIVDNNSKIVVSVEELVKAFVVGNLLKKSMNISVVKRFTIDCIPSEISSKVREQFNIVISELEINTESIVYIELSSNINELLCVYHKECLLSICDTENDLNMSDDQSSRDDMISNLFSFYTTSSNTDEVEPTTITVSESSINFSTTVVQTGQIEGSYSQKFVSTTIKSVDDGLRKSTGTIPKTRKERSAERARKFSKKGKTKKLDIVENPVIETYEEFPTQKLLLSVEEAIVECETDISKKNYEEICEEYVYEDIYGWNYLDRSLITELQCSTDYIDSIKHESDPLLNDIRDSTTGKNNIHLSSASIKLENKRIPKRQRSRWAYLRYSIMGCLISGLTRSMLSWISNNYIQICAFCLIWILKK